MNKFYLAIVQQKIEGLIWCLKIWMSQWSTSLQDFSQVEPSAIPVGGTHLDLLPWVKWNHSMQVFVNIIDQRIYISLNTCRLYPSTLTVSLMQGQIMFPNKGPSAIGNEVSLLFEAHFSLFFYLY